MAHTFEIGKLYSRIKINESVGGDLISYLPSHNKKIVCGCFNPKLNPNVPDKVIVGGGTRVRSAAKLFAAQTQPIPIFIKRHSNEWKYVGDYRVAKFSDSPSDLFDESKRSGRTNVSGVLYLKK